MFVPQDKKPRVKKPGRRNRPDSQIYVVRLPATPYSYVPGMGYVSQPVRFAAGPRRESPLVKLPVDFVSNGKPTGVYRWRPTDSPVLRLDRGPYVFDGRPSRIYLLQPDRGPPRANTF